MIRAEHPNIRTVAEYSAQIANRIGEAATQDDFLESQTFNEVTELFTSPTRDPNDIEVYLGAAHGCHQASKILYEKGLDGEGFYAMGQDFLSRAMQLSEELLCFAFDGIGYKRH